jgi:hypothetical protein
VAVVPFGQIRIDGIAVGAAVEVAIAPVDERQHRSDEAPIARFGRAATAARATDRHDNMQATIAETQNARVRVISGGQHANARPVKTSEELRCAHAAQPPLPSGKSDQRRRDPRSGEGIASTEVFGSRMVR